MDKIKVKHITILEEIETEEARDLLESAVKKYCCFIIVPLIFFIIFTGLMINESKNAVINTVTLQTINTNKFTTFLILMYFFSMATIIGIFVCIVKLKPYYKLLRIAKFNDKIRHEERIREKERRRIAEENKKEYAITTNDIEKTLQEKN